LAPSPTIFLGSRRRDAQRVVGAVADLSMRISSRGFDIGADPAKPKMSTRRSAICGSVSQGSRRSALYVKGALHFRADRAPIGRRARIHPPPLKSDAVVTSQLDRGSRNRRRRLGKASFRNRGRDRQRRDGDQRLPQSEVARHQLTLTNTSPEHVTEPTTVTSAGVDVAPELRKWRLTRLPGAAGGDHMPCGLTGRSRRKQRHHRARAVLFRNRIGEVGKRRGSPFFLGRDHQGGVITIVAKRLAAAARCEAPRPAATIVSVRSRKPRIRKLDSIRRLGSALSR